MNIKIFTKRTNKAAASTLFNSIHTINLVTRRSSPEKERSVNLPIFESFLIFKKNYVQTALRVLYRVHDYSRNERHLWEKKRYLFIIPIELNLYIYIYSEGERQSRRKGWETSLSIKFKRNIGSARDLNIYKRRGHSTTPWLVENRKGDLAKFPRHGHKLLANERAAASWR